MSTEIGAEKRRLSRSSSENEEVATEIATKEDTKSKDESKITKILDKQQHKEKLADEKDQKKDNKIALGGTTRGEEETAAAPTHMNNNVIPGDGSRQIIAVSANKNPTAFFQLARKFLMTNEMCDLSALEGAIVSAVDAAHLLERSKLASIVKIHTSYVNVEPKRRRQGSQYKGEIGSAMIAESSSSNSTPADKLLSSKVESSSITSSSVIGTSNSSAEELSDPLPLLESSSSKKSTQVGGTQQEVQQSSTLNSSSSLSGSGIRELRRARVLVTVKRTESYKRWLEDNPTQRQAIIAGTANVTAEDIVGGGYSSSNKNDRADLTTTTKDASTPSLSKVED